MQRKQILLVFGTRPEAVKMCPLVRELEGEDRFETQVAITAQHREMLDMVLGAFGVEPRFDLDIMEKNQTIPSITTRILERMGKIFGEWKPDIVLVHGDTTTTFASALAAFYHQITVGHVEAGLRTYNRYSPYPEEMNRTLVGDLAELHFAPTAQNRVNLEREGITDHVYVTGNTAIDAMATTVREGYRFKTPGLEEFAAGGKLILLTAHRRENLGEPMRQIFRAVRRLADDFPDMRFFYPVHLNSQVREVAEEQLSGHPRILLAPPTDVVETHNIMARCFFVMTDSGGIQEEAPALGRPVLVLRTETERPEAVAAGTVKISGVLEQDVYADAHRLLTDPKSYDRMARAINPYGDGQASRRIREALLHYFALGPAPGEFDPQNKR